MRMYWWNGADGRNFGDALNPVLLKLLAGIEPAWAAPQEAELIACGSVMDAVPPRWAGTMLGTGTIREGVIRDLSATNVLAVRGALTRESCHLPKTTALGDPGILAPLFLTHRVRKGDCVGVIPHFIDKDMAARHPGALLIDIRAPIPEVVEQVASCRLVYSSSLHGLIAADALGIPQVVEHHPEVQGGIWKFRDYASAFGDSIAYGTVHLTERRAMRHRQRRMEALWRSL